jgi:nicotinate phosphoribosyltransferase
VGTKLVTAYSTPALGGVYKLTAIEEKGRMQPKIKRSDNPEKVTNPGLKRVVRFFDDAGLMRGDVLFLEEEKWDAKPLRAYHPTVPHVSKVYPPAFSRKELLIPIFQEGRLIYDNPPLKQIQDNCRLNLDQLGLEFKRFKNPHIYHVSLSRQLMKTKRDLLKEAG